MSRSEGDATRIVRLWLEDGATVLPDRVLDAVLDELPATHQRPPSWLVRRTPTMNNTVRLVLAAAAVVAVALIGYQLLVAPNVTNPPDETPGPTPSSSPSISTPTSILGTTNLEPGTYAIGTWFPVQFDFTIADQWETWGTEGHIVRIWKPCQVGECEGFSRILTFELVEKTFADPCQAVLGPLLADGVDELVNALTTLDGFSAGPVTDVTIDGYPGKSFELEYVGPATASCVDGGTWQWVSSARVNWGPEALQRVVIVDVDGTRLVIDAILYAGDHAETDAIIDSIRIE